MLADIELGVINMVIFKDVSRLGREHIDTNYYLGKYFPEKQIRIVSILDNYDSAVGTYDEMLEIKTLLNDMYLRDTSRKIKTTIQTKRKEKSGHADSQEGKCNNRIISCGILLDRTVNSGGHRHQQADQKRYAHQQKRRSQMACDHLADCLIGLDRIAHISM